MTQHVDPVALRQTFVEADCKGFAALVDFLSTKGADVRWLFLSPDPDRSLEQTHAQETVELLIRECFGDKDHTPLEQIAMIAERLPKFTEPERHTLKVLDIVCEATVVVFRPDLLPEHLRPRA
jgi:hypothetical protein